MMKRPPQGGLFIGAVGIRYGVALFAGPETTRTGHDGYGVAMGDRIGLTTLDEDWHGSRGGSARAVRTFSISKTQIPKRHRRAQGVLYGGALARR